ncbi:hypothetical protein [Paenibacillus sp. OAS669]|uniref:hypothetical protein n=1 Tax=Paenibacillus sp. OAS669 TaxID=2663821 RepID=UPI0017896AE4|nr:hypothetical protein [Paenibacillus sp. OAS669]MBE1444323.1 hypothetical protein [Paenibacillus sp. OAS669]
MDDWVRSANNVIDSKRMEAAGLSAIESADYLSRRLEQDVGSNVKTIFNIVSGHYGQYVKILVVLLVVFSFLVARYLWLAAAHHLVNQAFDEMSKDKL